MEKGEGVVECIFSLWRSFFASQWEMNSGGILLDYLFKCFLHFKAAILPLFHWRRGRIWGLGLRLGLDLQYIRSRVLES